MKKEFKNFGLYGREEANVSSDFISLVSIDSSCRKHNWEIKPHFHSDLYQFFFIDSGSGTFIFNDKIKRFNGSNMIIIPENNLHGFNFNENIKGYTLSVSSHIIDKITQNDKELNFQINRVRLINFDKYECEFRDIMASVDRMVLELTLEAEKEKMFLETLLLLLIIKMYRMTIETEKEFVSSTRELGYYREFIKLIKKSIPTNRNITDFTKAIGISKSHLNRVCHTIAGISSKEVICKYLVNESMVLMTHTDMTISEIAYQLEFKDVSYFCRFFKKQVGISPLNYKNSNINFEDSNNKIAIKY